MAKRRAAPRDALRPTVAGVPISHPDRLIYPDLGLSKIDLAKYFEAIAECVLPHVAERPVVRQYQIVQVM
jgi:bifunctional non-homologous end joining protein LigD